jgi:hypothetical protein
MKAVNVVASPFVGANVESSCERRSLALVAAP